jgi:hypothetical protein
LDLSGTGPGPVADSFGYGFEPSVSIKDGEFIDYLSVLLADQEYWLSGVSLN